MAKISQYPTITSLTGQELVLMDSAPTSNGRQTVTATTSTIAQSVAQSIAAGIGLFSATQSGVIPASGGGASLVVRSDGTWQPAFDPATGQFGYYSRTTSEVSAGISPLNYAYVPGDIRRYGGVSGSDVSSATTSAAACNTAVTYPEGSWVMGTTPTVPAQVLLVGQPGSSFAGGGAGTLGFTDGSRSQAIESSTTTSEFATQYFRRNANHTGGTIGNTTACLRADSYVSSGVSNFEWTFLATMQNSATGGENVAIYGQANRVTTNSGPTWAAVFELRELNAVNDPTSGSVAVEIDVRANGTDTNANRIGVDVVCTRYNTSGAAANITYGVRVQNNNDGANSIVGFGFSVIANCTWAFDCATASIGSGAFRMAQNQAICFDAAGTNQLSFDGTGLVYKNATTPIARFNTNGALNIGTGVFGTSAGIISQVSVPTGGVNSSYQASDTLAGTSDSAGVLVQNTILASITASNYRGVEVKNPSLGAGAAITTAAGVYVNDITSFATNAYGVYSNVASGSGKYNFYAAGTGANFFNGDLQIPGAAQAVLHTLSGVTSGAGAQTGTLTNSPVSGNPTKWVPFNDAGTTRYFPVW